MSEYISREELVEALMADYNYGWDNSQDTEYVEGVRDEYDDALTIINRIKGVDIQPIKYGRWEDCSNGWMCTNCFHDSAHDTRYCPNCGARMDLKED